MVTAVAMLYPRPMEIDIPKVRIASVEDIRPAAIHFRDKVRELVGLRIAATDNIAARLPMRDAEGELLATTVFGWSEEADCWWADPRFALRTPLAEACRIESQPFWANRDGAWDLAGRRILEGFDFSYFGKTISHAASIVVPVHLPFSRIGLAAFSRIDDRRADLSEELRLHGPALYLMSHFFIGDYARLALTAKKWLPDPVALTQLEVACLRWISRGKTDDEVAIIMGRARPTIRFHLQNASLKLGAVNRTQAVFRAAQLGFLTAPTGSQVGEWSAG
ncbi:helix-turn-helix transcriptional regulator [Rhizorhabdus histidinilytica]|uniref:DNA-binding transcriptional regulator, CsgD family n=2 Tax=Rhizorhabdus histidinilytica TaxID=439228 RepID=A0A1T5GTK6_9SPHN|nr:helix-turn-helix transcriptional regulator [Rhizorhabdus histidinilytica]SKC11737.1 DNA-binding transcriptional regulator, CsgD family [Rhizorhabdus histidinilytica]